MGTDTALGSALYSRLNSTGGTALWSSRIYQDQAPQGAILPYVMFTYVAGGDMNISPSRIIDEVYQVECVAGTLSIAAQGADYIESALHNGSLSISGWDTIATTSVGRVRLVENVEGKQYFRRGHEIRVRASS